MNNSNQHAEQVAQTKSTEKHETSSERVDDSSGIYYSSVLKITDPSTGQILLHTRGE
jgi:hypothetical protein